MNTNPVVHFEMPYEDRDRAAAFYQTVFGWKTQRTGPEMGEYLVMQTAETDEKHMVKTPGAINGGMWKRGDNPEMNMPSVVISVDNLEQAMQNITSAGGILLDQPMDIPGIGRYISFKDSEGNRVSILQPAKM